MVFTTCYGMGRERPASKSATRSVGNDTYNVLLSYIP